MEGKIIIRFKLKYTHPIWLIRLSFMKVFSLEVCGVMICSISNTDSQELPLLYGQWPLLHPNDVGISQGCWWSVFLDYYTPK